MKRYRMIFSLIMLGFIGGRLFYELIAVKKHLYLINEYGYNFLTMMILGLSLFIYFKNKKLRFSYYGVIGILMILNVINLYQRYDNIEFLEEFSNGIHSFVIQETKDNPDFSSIYAVKYSNLMKLTGHLRVRNDYKPFTDGQFEVTWLNDDYALVECMDGELLREKAIILSFKSRNEDYTNVIGSLAGVYVDSTNEENSLTIEGGYITYQTPVDTYWYSDSSADEQGNYGTVLYGGDFAPVIYLLKNRDDSVTMGEVKLGEHIQSIYVKQ